MMMKRILYCGRQALTRTKVWQSPRGLTLFPPPVLGATRGADHRRLSSESRRRGACIQSFSISPTQMTDSRRRMSYYPSDEEDDKDYLLFKNLLDVPCEFLAKETKSFMDLISCDPSLLEEEGSVSKIINCVVVPTLLMESEDEELFETDYRRFISWETDSESRRKAYNLFEQIFTSCEKARVISLKEVVNLLDSRDWMEVEAGVKLAASMVRCSSVVLVDAKGFTMMWILPLLHRDDSPMVVKTSALCFLASAAHQGRVTTSWRGGIVSASFKLLNDQSMGVQSYACICLEELFKDNDCSSGHGEALVNLYVAFRKSQYNPYILRSIYQILLFCGISDEERLIHLLDMFEDLVSCPITEEHGFHVLREVIQKLDYEVIAPYMKKVWMVLLTAYADQTPVEFQKDTVISMSRFLAFHGTDRLEDSVNSVRPGAFIDFLMESWARSLKLITETNEIILTTAASTRLIFQSQALLDRSTDELCGEMLDSILQLVSNNEQELSQRFAAAKRRMDPLTDIKDPLHYLCNSLSTVSPARYKEIIDKYLCQDKRAYLSKLCARYNCEFFKEEGVNGDGETTEQL